MTVGVGDPTQSMCPPQCGAIMFGQLGEATVSTTNSLDRDDATAIRATDSPTNFKSGEGGM